MPLPQTGVEFVSAGFNDFIRNMSEATLAIVSFGRMTENKLKALNIITKSTTESIKAMAEATRESGETTSNAAKKTAGAAAEMAGGWVGASAIVVGSLRTLDREVGGIFKGIGKQASIWAAAGGLIGLILGGIAGGPAAALAVAPVTAALSAILAAIKKLFSNIEKAILSLLPKLLASIFKAGIQIGSSILQFGKSILTSIAKVASAVLSPIKSLISNIFGMFGNAGAARGGWRSLGDTIFSAMFKFEVLKQVIRGIINEIKGMAKASFDAAVELQTLTIRLDNLIAMQVRGAKITDDYGKSVEIASTYTQALLGWIQKMALTTPVSLEDVANTVSLSIAMGWTVEAAKKLTKAILDYTVGQGLSSEVTERIIYNFAQMKQQGKVTGTELRDLGRGAFMPINKILKIMQEQIGDTSMSFEEFRQQASEGKVSVEAFFTAFEEFVETNLPDAAYRMNFTFQAVRQNISDLFKTLVGWNVLGPVIKSITEPMQNFINRFKEVESMAKASVVGKTLAFIVNAVKTGFSELTQSVGEWLKAAGFVMPSFENIVISMMKFGMAIRYALTSLAGFIRTLIPFAGQVKSVIGGAFEGMSGTVVKHTNDTRDKLNRGMSKMSTDMFTWGANIIVSFAKGIVQAAAKVLTQALNYVARIITSLLSAQSPPKILPDITLWGLETMNAWLEGFTQADFSIFDDIAGAVKTSLDALVDLGELTELDALQQYSDWFVYLTKAIDDFNETGQFSAEVFDELAGIAGPFGQELSTLLYLYQDLADAQADLAEQQDILAALEEEMADAVLIRTGIESNLNEQLAIKEMLEKRVADAEAIREQMQRKVEEAQRVQEMLQRKVNEQLAIREKLERAVAEAELIRKEYQIQLAEAELISAKYQYEIEQATIAATKAQMDYDAAIKKTLESTGKTNKLVREYNDMLRKGAGKDVLKNKLKLINASEEETSFLRKNENMLKKQAEDAKLAQEQAELKLKEYELSLEPLKEQIRLIELEIDKRQLAVDTQDLVVKGYEDAVNAQELIVQALEDEVYNQDLIIQGLEDEVEAQDLIVQGWEDQLDAQQDVIDGIQEEIDAQEEVINNYEEAVSSIEDQIATQIEVINHLGEIARIQDEIRQAMEDSAGAGNDLEESLENIEDFLGGLGDAGAGFNIDFEGILSQAAAQWNKWLNYELPKLWEDAWNVNFVDPNSPFQKALGTVKKAWGELWDELAKMVNLPSWDEIMEAWSAPSGEGGPSPLEGPAGQMEDQVLAPAGLIERFQRIIDLFARDIKENGGILATLGNVAKTIFTALVNKIKEAATDPKNQQAVKDAINGFMTNVTNLILGEETLAHGVAPAGVETQTPWATRLWEALIENIKKAWDSVKENIDFNAIIWEIFKFNAKVPFSIGVAIIEALWNGIFVGGFIWLKGKINELREKIIEWWNDVTDSKSPAKIMIPIGTSIVEGLYDGIVSAVTDLWKTVEKGWEDFIDLVKEFFGIGSASELMDETFGEDIILGFYNGIVSAVTSKWNTVKAGWEDFIEQVKGFFGIGSASQLMDDEFGEDIILGFYNGIVSAVTDLWETVKKGWEDFITQVKGFFGIGSASQLMDDEFGEDIILGFYNGIVSAVTDLWETIKAGWDNFIDLIKTFFGISEDSGSQLMNDTFGVDIIVGFYEGIVAAITSQWNTVKAGFQGFIDSIKSFFGFPGSGETDNKMYDIGGDTVTEFGNGIADPTKQTALERVVAAIFGSLPNWVKKLLGMGSPSSVMYAIGADTTQGFINGIESKAAELHFVSDEIYDQLPDNILDKYQDFSPSRVFHQMGANIVQSIIDGINGMETKLYNKVGELVSVVPSTIGTQYQVGYSSNVNRGAVFGNNYQNRLSSLRIEHALQNAPQIYGGPTVNFGNVYINNDMDWAVFKAQVQRAIIEG